MRTHETTPGTHLKQGPDTGQTTYHDGTVGTGTGDGRETIADERGGCFLTIFVQLIGHIDFIQSQFTVPTRVLFPFRRCLCHCFFQPMKIFTQCYAINYMSFFDCFHFNLIFNCFGQSNGQRYLGIDGIAQLLTRRTQMPIGTGRIQPHRSGRG